MLIRKLFGLQHQQADLLEEKDQLVLRQYTIFDGRFSAFTSRIKTLMAQHHIKDMDVQSQLEELKNNYHLQLADEQNKAGVFKQELDIKTVQLNQMSVLLANYQKKLETKDDAYNQQLGQVLVYKNGQDVIASQIARINAKLQRKEEQLIRIKRDMDALRALTKAKDQELQIKDLQHGRHAPENDG